MLDREPGNEATLEALYDKNTILYVQYKSNIVSHTNTAKHTEEIQQYISAPVIIYIRSELTLTSYTRNTQAVSL